MKAIKHRNFQVRAIMFSSLLRSDQNADTTFLLWECIDSKWNERSKRTIDEEVNCNFQLIIEQILCFLFASHSALNFNWTEIDKENAQEVQKIKLHLEEGSSRLETI